MLLVNAILRMLEIVGCGLFIFVKKITMNTDFQWLMGVAMFLVIAGIFYLIFEMLKIKATVFLKRQNNNRIKHLCAYRPTKDLPFLQKE